MSFSIAARSFLESFVLDQRQQHRRKPAAKMAFRHAPQLPANVLLPSDGGKEAVGKGRLVDASVSLFDQPIEKAFDAGV